MKKIPTLFKRVYDEVGEIKEVLPEVTEGFEWVLEGKGVATVKYDGSCCAIIDGEFYKRYDAKHGKPIPEGAIKCQEEADPITGHLPCWVKCDRDNPADKWFWSAYDNTKLVEDATRESPCNLSDGTYEAVGKHFNGNPYLMSYDILIMHGLNVVKIGRSFKEIKDYLEQFDEEGIVFWKDGEPRCKIKCSDFGFDWKAKRKENRINEKPE